MALVNEMFIGLTWALCGLGQAVEYLKNLSWVWLDSVQYMTMVLTVWSDCVVNDWYIWSSKSE